MQVVSDSQRRPSKGRLKIEKRIIDFVHLCTSAQLVMIFYFIVKLFLAVNCTFDHSIFITNEFALNPVLKYKTKSCTYSTVRDFNAFNGITLTLDASNVDIIFADHVFEMKSILILSLLTVFFGILNRIFIDINFFSLKIRNMDLQKDIFSATELLLLTYLVQSTYFSRSRSSLLRDYLSHCGVTSMKYLPWVSVNGLFIVASVGYLTYLITLIIYLRNTLPKYGIMTPDEIEEYKAWLRLRKAESEQARVFIEQAKMAHARMFYLRNRTLPIESSGLHGSISHQAIPTPMNMLHLTTQNTSLAEAGLGNPCYDIYSNMSSAQNLPPPQMFGGQPELQNHANTSRMSYMNLPR
ncbi:unnamed protein product [Phytomonas sp. Hart1]|nr:unnamed protein product [Phytomonas sp. Hart1]|eukprot:CCW66367.1 unnamed protein product [Phytomonas sp. isolate Hart1]